jgi:glycolate oxidase FAD binding subunit
VPLLVVSPASEDEVAAVLSWASRDRLAVVVRGGGTKLAWGAPPQRCDVVLSTSRLSGVVEHEPGDLVCVARAGTTLASLQEALAAHGQRLALDPPHGVAATLGGIVATGAHGPLRTQYGTARDLVLGARFVLADGTVGHSGGKVVKNVAGYDVAKLLIGSLGTLAVVTEVSLRLHPLPQTSQTVAWQNLNVAAADAVRRAVERAPVVPAAAVLLWPSGAMLVRIEGTAAGVHAQVDALLHCAGDDAPAPRCLDGKEARKAWDYTAMRVWNADPTAAIAGVSVPRVHLSALLDRLSAATEAAVVLPALGVAEARLRAGASGEDVAALRTWAAQRGGHVTLRRTASADLGALAWPPAAADDAAVDLMRAVKRALDPRATLAPGRHLAM